MNMEEKLPDARPEEVLTALFGQLVMQQTNMALMLLGKMANPTNGEFMRDPEAAAFFIDQLVMLEVKTRGNLAKEEETLLKQSLMSLRLAFVETVNHQESRSSPPAKTVLSGVVPDDSSPTDVDPAAAKKFSKKY